MKPAKDFLGRIVQKYDLQTEAIPGQPLVEIWGNSRVIIENHHGVTGYEPHEIRIRMRQGTYFVCGSGLKIAQMTNTALVICGRIEAVRLCGGQNHA